MVLLDVNVVVTAMREDAPRHREVNAYVEDLRRAPEPFGLSELGSGSIGSVRSNFDRAEQSQIDHKSNAGTGR